MRRKNLIAGSICLAVLPCFALFAVAQQQRPAAQQPAASPATCRSPGGEAYSLHHNASWFFDTI